MSPMGNPMQGMNNQMGGMSPMGNPMQGMNNQMGGMPPMGNPYMQNMYNPYNQMHSSPYNYGQNPYMVNNSANAAKKEMTDEEYKKIYAEKLGTLKEMGFKSEELNVIALKKTGGNVEAAIELLFKWREDS